MKKRALSGILFFFLVFLLCAAIFATVAPDLSNAYALDSVTEINDDSDFADFCLFASENSTVGRKFLLNCDLVLPEDFSPIGGISQHFNGEFDGNGHKIEYSLSLDDNYVGLFAYVGTDGIIRNLQCEGTAVGKEYVGGIVGFNNGKIIRCKNKVEVLGSSRAGGIAGYNSGEISECINDGKVTAEISYGGGIVGMTTGGVTGCFNANTVAVTFNGGGISGEISGDGGFVGASVNAGEIVGNSSSRNIGGLVGEVKGTVTDCYNYAAVSASGTAVGSALGRMSAVYSSARVYNVGTKSTRNVVGLSDVTLPDDGTFGTVSEYEVLVGNLFEGAFVKPTFDIGYGYLDCPTVLTEENYDEYVKVMLFETGDGTENSPFVLANARQLDLFAKNVTVYDYDGVFVKLDLSLDLGEFIPFGTGETVIPFNGNFDGNGNSLSFSFSGERGGLFDTLGENGTVKNLVISADITAKSAGIVATDCYGRVENVTTNGSVVGTEYVGGTVGRGYSANFLDCENGAEVKGNNFVGGIFGYMEDGHGERLVNCGKITANSADSYTDFGGIGGKVKDSSFDNLLNKAEVSAYRASNVGGLFGSADGENTVINGGMNIGDTTGRRAVGGIVGDGKATICGALVYADVNGASYIGGISGRGMAEITSALFIGLFGTVAETRPEPETFRTIAQSGAVLNEVYYNGDLILDGTDGVGKSYVSVTDNLFDGDGIICLARKRDCGYFPLLNWDRVLSDGNIKKKTEYFYFADGNGETPFVVSSEQQYRNMAELINSDSENYASLRYELGANITFTRETPAIGIDGFTGEFNGKFYKLFNVNFDGAMFVSLRENALVENVALERGISTEGSVAVTVESNATVRGCYSLLTLQGNNCGGIVSTNNGTVSECVFLGRVVGENVGGIVYNNFGNIANCAFGGYVQGNKVGGVAAINTGRLTGTVVSGAINGSDGKNTGGFFGAYSGMDNRAVTNSFFIGKVLIDGKQNAETAEEAAFFAGTLSGALPTFGVDTGVYYTGYDEYVKLAYHTVSGEQSGKLFSLSASEFVSPGFINKFTGVEYIVVGERDIDSDYAPINAALLLSDRMESLAKRVSAVGLFGRDYLSFEEWGSENNPYLISRADELAILSDSVNNYDYSGKYFKIVSDLDFNNVSFVPIGRFIAPANAGNRPFNGILDGNYHVISNLRIAVSEDYTGLFVYTGRDFTVKNLMLDKTCSVSSSSVAQLSYVGSIVGYNRGTVTNVISYATVSGNSFVGGLVGFSENNTEISYSVYAGELTSGYGITGQRATTVNLKLTGSKYLVVGDGSFLQASTVKYVHNDYGDVLFVDRGGSVSVAFIDGEITFTAVSDLDTELPSEKVRVQIMTQQDVSAYTGRVFRLTDFNATSLAVRYFVRFTYLTAIDFAEGSESKLNSLSYGQGYYYEGQRITFTLNIKYGYYIRYIEEYADAVTFGEEGDRITLTFETVLNNFECKLPVGINYFGDNYEVDAVSDIYDGNPKTHTVDLKEGAEEIFAPFEYVWYDATQNKCDEIKSVGEYTAKIRLILKNSDITLGIGEVKFTVTPKELTLADDGWEDYAVKEYDETNVLVGKSVGNLILGVADGDIDGVTVSARVVFADSAVGPHGAVVSDFVLSGESANNYFIAQRDIETTGTITQKVVKLTVRAENLSGRYDGNKPVISGVTFDKSIGTARIGWEFIRTGDTEVWQGTWDIGAYVAVPTVNNDNYGLTYDEIIYTILPKVIESVTYSGYDRLSYTGSSLNSDIKGIYVTDNGARNYVDFKFYTADGEEVSYVINAGEYKGIPYISDGNYELAEIQPLSFTVKKATAPSIEFSLSASSVTVGERIKFDAFAIIAGGKEIDFADMNARLIAETVSEYGLAGGKAEIAVEEDGIYLVPTKYPLGRIFRFRIGVVDGTNYQDAFGEITEITVLAGKIFVGLSENSRNFTYGDIINLQFIYSFDLEQTEIIDPTEIANFVAPSYIIEDIDGVGDYGISFYGGSSDGYVIEPSKNSVFTVGKKQLRITVEENGSKVYGDKEEEVISFTVTNSSAVPITVLPDGTEIVLNGKLGRAEGENAGRYAINRGTLTEENNKNYALIYDFSDRYFEITQRHVSLIVPEYSKEYGDEDPNFALDYDKNYPFAEGENPSVLNVTVTRAQGENVGEYSYIKGYYDGGRNYIIDRVDTETNKFRIYRATPSVIFYESMFGTLRYGDSVSKLTVVGDAYSHGETVKGSFKWLNPEEIAVTVGQMNFGVTFKPSDGNYAEITTQIEVNVLPRIAEVAFEGSRIYTYNGRVQGGTGISAKVLNAMEDDAFSFIYAYDNGASVNAGTYKVYLTDLGNDKYVLDGTATDKGLVFEYEIKQAPLTVGVTGGKIMQGEKFVAEISYEGFVNGEDEKVLRRKPTVDIPTDWGIHSIKADGAQADNYFIVYRTAELVIERNSVSSENVIMEGNLGISLTLTAVNPKGTAMENAEKEFNSALKYNLLIPNMQKVKDYYELRYNGKADGEFGYTVQLDLADGNKVFVKLYDGKIVELTDYEEVSTDEETGLTTIYFTHTQVSAIAVYENKEIKALLMDFIPLIAVVAVVIITVAIVALSAYNRSKKFKKEKKYLAKYD